MHFSTYLAKETAAIQKEEEKNFAPLHRSGLPIATDYEGIPLIDIVAAMQKQANLNPISLRSIDGESDSESSPSKAMYFHLAMGIRYLTDFDEERMFINLPNMGLGKRQRVQLIRVAIKRPRTKHIPTWVDEAIAQCKAKLESNKQDGHFDILALRDELVLPKLPRILDLMCSKVPNDFRPAMVIASLPILGALATGVRLRYYDGSEHSFSFFSCVTAPQASGKSFIRKPIDMLLKPINEQDAIAREEERKYKHESKILAKQGIVTDEVHPCIRNVGVNTTVARLLQLLGNSGGKHLIGVCAEIDSMQRNERAGARGQKQDIFRLAFDNDCYSQENMGVNSYSGNEHVYYNVLVTGTLNATYRYFNDTENGLVSRVAFAQLPENMGGEMPIFGDYTQEEQDALERTSLWLMKRSDRLECSEVMEAIHHWVQKKGDLALASDSKAIDILRKRSAVIGFRAGCLCWLLGQEEENMSEAEAAQIGLWVAEYVFRNQLKLFGKQFERTARETERKSKGHAVENLLEQLPHEFNKQDLLYLRAKNHQSRKISMVLTRWNQKGWIEKTGRGTYRKCS